VTVSLDTLRPERMREFAREPHDDVVAGIQAARHVGFQRLKLNTVVVRGFNDDELADLIEFGRSHDAEVRFIEYMDVGGATRWTTDRSCRNGRSSSGSRAATGPSRPVGTRRARRRRPCGSAYGRHRVRRHRVRHGAVLRLVRPQPPHGRRYLVLCLYAARGVDLREPLRRGARTKSSPS